MTTVSEGDRELLELAAKAARIVIVRSRLDDPLNRDMLIENSPRNPFQRTGPWNPLDDDGDALRLANATGTCIEFGYCLDDAPIVRCGAVEDRDSWPEVGNFPNPGKATRRAIVEAVARAQREYESVASIGKEKQ